MRGSQLLEDGAAAGDRLVQLHIHGAQPIDCVVVPAFEETLDRRPSRVGGRGRPDPPDRGRICGEHRFEEVLSERLGRCVATVREHDDPEPRRRMPAHVRAEAGVAAGVHDDPSVREVIQRRQPEAVGAALELRRGVGRGGRDGPFERPLRLLHLAPAGAAQGMAAFGLVPRRECIHEPGHPAGEVADAAEHAAHRRERTVAIARLIAEGLVPPQVAASETGRRDIAFEVRRRRHDERPQESIPDDFPVFPAGDVRDQATEDPVAEVRVFEPEARRPREREAAAKELGERAQVEALLPITPGIVGREAGGHRQEVPDRDRRRVGRRSAEIRELGDMVGDGIVEPEPALVAEEQHRCRGEALGHRGDPEDAVGVGWRVLAYAKCAEPAGVDKPVPEGHAIRQARDLPAGERALGDGVNAREGNLERHGPPCPRDWR